MVRRKTMGALWALVLAERNARTPKHNQVAVKLATAPLRNQNKTFKESTYAGPCPKCGHGLRQSPNGSVWCPNCDHDSTVIED